MVVEQTSIRPYLSDPVMESFYDMRNAQEPKDRLHYFDTVLEANTEMNATLLQKLYVDIISKSNIDFGSIPDSKGVLINYKEYKLMSESMAALNTLFTGMRSEELNLMNQLHDMIISCKKDYEFGYQFDIQMIKITYCTAVMTLFELINICILAYTRQMRKTKQIEFNLKKTDKKNLIFIRGAKSLIKCYTSGQWRQIISEFKKDPKVLEVSSVAQEASIAANAIDLGLHALNVLGPTNQGQGKLSQAANVAGQAAKSMWNKAPKPLKIIGTAVIAFIGLLIAVRGLVYLYFHSANKIKDYVKNQKMMVDAVTRTNMQDGAPEDKIAKSQKLADNLESVADFIEVRILKSDSDAKRDLQAVDKESYNPSELKASAGLGGSIEF